MVNSESLHCLKFIQLKLRFSTAFSIFLIKMNLVILGFAMGLLILIEELIIGIQYSLL